MYSTRNSCQSFMKLEFFLDRFSIKSSKFTKIRPVGVQLFYADGRTDGQTDVTKIIVTFRNFANAPKRHTRTHTHQYRYMCVLIHSLAFSLRGRVGRNQSPVMWPVWFWHTASWASSWGVVCHCFPPHVYTIVHIYTHIQTYIHACIYTYIRTYILRMYMHISKQINW